MLVWAHGLWGSPNGSKITAIKNSGIEVVAPDFNEMELIDRITLIEKVIDEGNIVLAGSSWGGLACALVAQRKPEKIKGLLLLAPALHYPEHPNDNPEKLVAPENILCIVVTLDTFQLEISPLKSVMNPANMKLILVTLDTSQFDKS